MVKQGDIIKVNLDPTKGHEQAGYRPVLVVSNNYFNRICNIVLICPITNTVKDFPLHVLLDGRTVTTGRILCSQIRAIDIENRDYVYVEKLPDEMMEKVILVLKKQVEKSRT